MTSVNVLTPGFTSSNGSAFLFPLVVHRNSLREAALEVRIVDRSTAGLTDCDLLAVDSKEFRDDWGDKKSRTLDLIASYHDTGTKVVWVDTTDGTGTLQAPVLPLVDKYLKSQLLTDRNRYTERIYGGRLHSDYYNKTAGITDDETATDEPIAHGDVAKLGVSWNSGLADYSIYGPRWIGLYRRIKLARLLRYRGAMGNPESQRQVDLSARFGSTYSKATVRYQRERIREILAARQDTQKLGRRSYIAELTKSKVVLSPFGWGEITLKDFEVFLTGGMLLKPSMNHMETWPDFYEENVTYLPHDWNLENLEERIEWAVEHASERTAISAAGQSRYLEYTSGPTAPELFTEHLKSLVADVIGPTENVTPEDVAP